MMTPEAFRRRYALASFTDGGVILDTATGTFSHLNASASVMFAAMERSREADQAIEIAAASLVIPREQAARDLHALLDSLRSARAPETPPGLFRYTSSPDGFDLHEGMVHALH